MESFDIPDMEIDGEFFEAFQLEVLRRVMRYKAIADEKDVDSYKTLVVFSEGFSECKSFHRAGFDIIVIPLQCRVGKVCRPLQQFVEISLKHAVGLRCMLIVCDEEVQRFMVLINGVSIDLQFGITVFVLLFVSAPDRAFSLTGIGKEAKDVFGEDILGRGTSGSVSRIESTSLCSV
ncbi:MAG: hypothetical protein IPO87_18790 [Flavobacteriales bacterium]|nr:hypothetical protein [Flavobacteriales bacterium]